MSYKSAYKRIPKTIKKCSPKAIKIKFSTGSFHMVLVIHQSISESSKGFSDFTNYPGVMTSIRTFNAERPTKSLNGLYEVMPFMGFAILE